jgi:hypothetical protein
MAMTKPLTLGQAKALKYGQTVYTPGYYNSDGSPQRWRVSGSVQTWVRSPGRVRVPIKHGMYENWAIDESNLNVFTLTEPEHQPKKSREIDHDHKKALKNPAVIRAIHGLTKK